MKISVLKYFLSALAMLILFRLEASEISLTNLAKHQKVKASSEEEPASAAVDGNAESYWQSAGMVGTHWLEVELDKAYPIDRIVLPLVKGANQLIAEVWVNNKWQKVGELPKDNPMIAFGAVNTHRIRLTSIEGQPLKIYEVQVFAHDPQPVFVNQLGYDKAKPKRFTAPLAENATPFKVVKAGTDEAVYRGIIRQHIGDFSDFQPDSTDPYQLVVEGTNHHGRSVPFLVADGLIEKASYQAAIDFMVDVRCWFGDSQKYNPTDEDADCPNLGVAWRDSHQFSYEIPSLLNLYFANPEAFSTKNMPLQALYLGMSEELPEDTPEIIRLIYWAVDIYLRGEVNHTLLKEQLAYFLYAYPYISDYIPSSVYDKAKNYLFDIWGNEEINRWQWHDIEHSGDLFQVYDIIGTGKGQFPPGHNVVPNLMMYEVAKREGREDAERYFDAAYQQTQWLIENLDWTDPRSTKGQRQGEHITLTSMAYFLKNYPKKAPKGLKNKIQAWADIMISRADNMWDYRRYSDQKWIIPTIWDKDDARYSSETGFNEVGNIAGFPAPAFAVTPYLKDNAQAKRLEEMALAYVDHIFGRNPTGRHFGFDAAEDVEGVEMGWYKEWQGGAGILQTARGVLDGTPKETTYPYNPHAGDPGHTEGWVTFNTAWNVGLAYLSSSSTSLEIYDDEFAKISSQAKRGTAIGIELKAPLNFDHEVCETVEVQFELNGKIESVSLTEVQSSSNIFRGTFTLADTLERGKAKISYGLAWHQKSKILNVR